MNETMKFLTKMGSAVNARPFEHNVSGVSRIGTVYAKKTPIVDESGYSIGTRADPNTPTEIERHAMADQAHRASTR